MKLKPIQLGKSIYIRLGNPKVFDTGLRRNNLQKQAESLLQRKPRINHPNVKAVSTQNLKVGDIVFDRFGVFAKIERIDDNSLILHYMNGHSEGSEIAAVVQQYIYKAGSKLFCWL